MPTNQEVVEKFYGQVSESIKSLFDLSSRIDERVKNLITTDNQTNVNIHRLADDVRNIQQRLAVIESRDFISLMEQVGEIEKKSAIIDRRLSQLEKDIGHLNQWKVQTRDLVVVNDKRIAFLEAAKNDDVVIAIDKRVILLESNEKDTVDFQTKLKDNEERLRLMELKYEAVNIFKENTEKKHWMWTDLGFKLVWTVAAAYLLWKLGLQSPPSP